MTQQTNLHSNQIFPASYLKPMIIGAGIALLVISFFVFGVDNPKPEWGDYWIIRPLLITPLAGAIGGAFFAFLYAQSSKKINKALAIFLSLIVYLIGLWVGIVLGLDGTMWD